MCKLYSLSLFLLVSLFSQKIYTQSIPLSPALEKIAENGDTGGWVKFKEEVHIRPETLFTQYKIAFGLGDEDEMRLYQHDEDKWGYSHDRYQLYHKNIAVEGAVLFTHALDGRVVRVNGLLPRNYQIEVFPQLDANRAFQAALNAVKADQYMWESPVGEAIIQSAKKDPKASFYPRAELLIVDTDFNIHTHQYRLAYKFDIFTAQPHGNKWVYVDALTGNILKDLDVMPQTCELGLAETMYNGTRNICTDSTGNGYRLRDYQRLETGIITLNSKGNMDLNSAVDFYDEDNYWNEFEEEKDRAATDVHWGSAMTIDYFKEVHGRNSYDNQGGSIINFYNFPGFGAFWNVYYAAYSNGGNDLTPPTCLDIVAHEITHGVVRNTANLVYAYESAAINEAFADIFGTMVEFWVNPDEGEWLFSDCQDIPFMQRRYLSNPKSGRYYPCGTLSCPRPYPDTYIGNGWWDGEQDNGGAHRNSTVMSHWFYLLSEGGDDINDKGNSFQVDGIGKETAADIAYRALMYYLTPHAQFIDARMATIAAAEDLFGICSDEAIQTTNAWYAVGLGNQVQTNDFAFLSINPLPNCNLSDNENVTANFVYLGCDTPTINSIWVAFEVNSQIAIVEEVPLPDDFQPGIPFSYTFTQSLTLSTEGTYDIRGTIASQEDLFPENNYAFASTFSNTMIGDSMFFNFENSDSNFLNYMHFDAGKQVSIELSNKAGNMSEHGILMQGGKEEDFQFIECFELFGGPEIDIFDYNPDFSARLCFCLDLSNVEKGSTERCILSFEVKQIQSPYYQFGNCDSVLEDSCLKSNALRILIGSEEIARFYPNSIDSFNLHQVDLTPYIDQPFSLCFESKLTRDSLSDPCGSGDQILLDNIGFERVVSTENSIDLSQWKIFPNPADNVLNILFEDQGSIEYQLELADMLGRNMLSKKYRSKPGSNQLQLGLKHLSKGVYLLIVGAQNKSPITQKIWIH